MHSGGEIATISWSSFLGYRVSIHKGFFKLGKFYPFVGVAVDDVPTLDDDDDDGDGVAPTKKSSSK